MVYAERENRPQGCHSPARPTSAGSRLGQQSQIGPMVNIDEFIVNIISGDAAHYVKASLTVELTNEQVKN